MRKLTLLSLAILLMASFLLPAGPLFDARAQETAPEILNYTGEGVVWRSPVARKRTFTLSSISQLEVAYLECDQNYLVPGKAATWTVKAEGGSGEFQFQFVLFYKAPDDPSPYYSSVPGGVQDYSASTTFTRTINQPGTYIVRLRIQDSEGQELEYHSQKYTASNTEALAARVSEVAALCNAAAASDYGKALYLNTWLMNNA
ncbi:MAG: hypothetical protein GX650_07030, partial [Clostridiales bacterium]|nr:hypothetical protein [Clostridiales bacterium]